MPINIEQLSEAELVDLNHRVVARLKYLREMRTHRQMMNFRTGDRVTFQPPGHEPLEGIILKHNRKTVTVLTDDHQQWNVAPVFLSKVISSVDASSQDAQVIRLPKQR